MAQKKITELQLRSSVSSDCNFPVDDGTQSYRVTATQIRDFILSAGVIVRSMIAPAERIPIATVLPFAGATAPTGFVFCDGSAISRTTYADLFAVIGTTYGVGNGSSTFNLPNTSGVFIQGAGSQVISSKTFAGTLAAVSRDSTAMPQSAFSTGSESSSHSHVQNYGNGGGGGVGNNGFFQYSSSSATNMSTGTQSANHNHSIVSGGDTVTKPGSIVFNHVIKY